MCSLQNDRNIIKPADKASAVVVWDRQEYLKEAKQQLSDSSIYKEVQVTEEYLVDLVDKSNKIFVDLERESIIQKSYFKFNFKKATNVGKFYLLPNWDAHRKNFEILRSPFTATHETKWVVNKGYWRFSWKIEESRRNS